MSKYDSLKEGYKDAPALQRLAALRIEMINPVSTIRGYATLLARINPEDPATFPIDYRNWVEKIINAASDIHSVLDALTSDMPKE